MGLIFGKKKKESRITEQDKAVLQLKQQRDKIKQYQKRIEGNLEKDRLLAKKLLENNQKDRAKLLLRKKRFQEQLLERAEGQLHNLERMTHDVEFAQIEIRVVDGLRVGNEALKKLNEALNIDEIEKILDETNEGIEKQKEIDRLLCDGALSDEDEERVLAEYDDLLKETEELEVMETEFPKVPTEELPEVEDKDRERAKRVKKDKEAALAV